jgi:hypothetical protein
MQLDSTSIKLDPAQTRVSLPLTLTNFFLHLMPKVSTVSCVPGEGPVAPSPILVPSSLCEKGKEGLRHQYLHGLLVYPDLDRTIAALPTLGGNSPA